MTQPGERFAFPEFQRHFRAMTFHTTVPKVCPKISESIKIRRALNTEALRGKSLIFYALGFSAAVYTR